MENNLTAKATLILGIFFSTAVFARPYPSTGRDLHCSLDVYDVTNFTPCSYGPSCMVSRSEAVVEFESVREDLNQHLTSTLSVNSISPRREANGGEISEETKALAELLSMAGLTLKIDYANPMFQSSLSSLQDPENFQLSFEEKNDMSKGTRTNGPKSKLTKLKSNQFTDGGIYGQILCDPSRH